MLSLHLGFNSALNYMSPPSFVIGETEFLVTGCSHKEMWTNKGQDERPYLKETVSILQAPSSFSSSRINIV
jgi:hypothetical protein